MFHIEQLQHPVIRASDLRIGPGERVALSGSSGTGKSVCLRCLADLLPCEASLTLDGQHHRDMPAHVWRRQVMYMPAEPAWWSNRVADHFPEQLRLPFSRLGLSEDLLEQDPLRLSSGQRQRLALLRTLAREPRVLLLDEPTANLDDDNARKVEALLEEWSSAGGMLLFTSHDARQRKRLAGKLWRILDHEVVEQAW